MLIGPWLASFVAYYSELALDIVIDHQFVDIVAGGIDRGGAHRERLFKGLGCEWRLLSETAA